MKLHRIPLFAVLNAGDGVNVFAISSKPEAVRALRRRATSDNQFLSKTLKENGPKRCRFPRGVLRLAAGRTLPPSVHHELQSVADAEHWHASRRCEHRPAAHLVVNRPGRSRGNCIPTKQRSPLDGRAHAATEKHSVRCARSCVYCAPVEDNVVWPSRIGRER
jgi:hypothetical protein